jgi:UDP-N-acetyl-D-glucosamine dehydrogenase
MKSIRMIKENIRRYDCVAIVTDHTQYDYEWVVKNSKLIVDTRNATKKFRYNKIIKA